MEKRYTVNVKLSRILFLTLLALILIPNTEVYAGITGKIAGVVRDSETGETLPAANIVIVGTNMGAAADKDGYFYITNVPPGTYSAQARMMGYESVTKTGVEVTVDHTTIVDFELRSVAVEVPGITVVAEREIIKKDISSSQIMATDEEVKELPLVTNINEYLNQQAGVENLEIRGGEIYQNSYFIDGLVMVDNRTNEALITPNLSTIKEVNLIKGGFQAEYGNVRSGLINVVTKEGSSDRYHGSIDFRYIPAYQKHRGHTIFDKDCYFLRPYLETEDSVCWLGTSQWPDSIRERYPEFEGWIEVSEDRLSDDKEINDLSPEECRDLFIWLHRAEGADELTPEDYEDLTGRKSHEGIYFNKPDWTVDVGFGGPVPILNKFADLSFFVSYKTHRELFGLPVYREYYKEDNSQIKLTYRMNRDMKFNLVGLYGVINSLATNPGGIGANNNFCKSGEDVFNIGQVGNGNNRLIYMPTALPPFDVYRNMLGISFDHALTPSAFYNIRLTYINAKNECLGGDDPDYEFRDTTIITNIGPVPLNEVPYGLSQTEYEWGYGRGQRCVDEKYHTRMGALGNSFDTSGVQTINLKADLTFQVNKYNQLKMGLEYNYDELTTIYGEWNGSWDDSINMYVSGSGGLEFEKSSNWKHYPIRAGAYIQDKIEYEGVIANIGVRMDYSNPNSDWYTVDRYSQWFKPRYMFEFEEKAPTEPSKSHLKLSPRFGISHPISEVSKLYFNYGWFYGMPESEHLYRLEYGVLKENEGVQWIGNPSLDPARTIAYELGYEHNLFNQYLIHIAGYYKDITNQTGSVRYTGYMGLVNYRTYENKNYADIRGFEFSVRKRFGRWIKGWFNYDYRVQTSGYIGRNQYYQDVREQRIYGWQNPYQEKPLARPVLRAMITLITPKNWGPTIGNINPIGGFDLTLVYSQKAGSYFTWDPLETYELVDNLQWETYSNWDLRLEKVVNIAGAQIDLFMDIHNIFDKKHLHHSLGFEDSNDRESYLSSLHLPMYDDEKYIEQGFTPGNDKPGDIKSDGKPYIDMPNKELFTFFDPRYISLGLRIEF